MSNDFKATGVDWNAGGHTGLVRFGEDVNLLVMFYNKSVHIPALSTEGRPVYRDEIFIKIQQPGEVLNIIDRPVVEQDKHRFKRQWANFCHDRTQVPEGSPIILLFPNHPAVAENLRGVGVYTIEQCAELSASAIDTIGRGAQEYVNRAKKYLEMANKGQSFHKLQAELDTEKQKNRIMEQQISELKNQMNSMNMKLVDPVRASLAPPFVMNYDAQSERINNNAPTKEAADKAKRNRRTPTVEEQITNPLMGSEDSLI